VEAVPAIAFPSTFPRSAKPQAASGSRCFWKGYFITDAAHRWPAGPSGWLEQAQATNDLDAHLYSHGVFEREPENATRSGDRAIDVRTGRVPQTGGGKGNGVSGA
jgi:hypothetical protein